MSDPIPSTTVDLLKLDTYLIDTYSANMCLAKGFLGQRWTAK